MSELQEAHNLGTREAVAFELYTYLLRLNELSKRAKQIGAKETLLDVNRCARLTVALIGEIAPHVLQTIASGCIDEEEVTP